MTNLDIKINIKELSNYSGYLRKDIDEETLLLIIESFADYVRKVYLFSIREAIYSKRYKGKWEPVEDEGYLSYIGTTPSKNIMTLIEEALLVEKIGYNFFVRIDPHYYYPDSRYPLIRVLRAIENGTTRFNARPLFYLIVREINQSILLLWRGYLLQRGVG